MKITDDLQEGEAVTVQIMLDFLYNAIDEGDIGGIKDAMERFPEQIKAAVAIDDVDGSNMLLDTMIYSRRETEDTILEIVKILVQCDAPLNKIAYLTDEQVDEPGQVALLPAIFHGFESIVEFLLQSGANPNVIDDDKEVKPFFNPLHAAVDKSSKAIVKLLLTYGANINQFSPKDLYFDFGTKHNYTCEKLTPLGLAVFKSDSAMAKFLLSLDDKKPNVNLPNDYGYTPLHYAAFHRDKVMVNILLDAGANPDQLDHNKLSPIHIATINAEDEENGLLRKLMAHNENQHLQNEANPMKVGIKLIEDALKNGADVRNNVNLIWGGGVYNLIQQDNFGLLDTLIKHGLDISGTDTEYKNALELSVEEENYFATMALFERMEDINLTSHSKEAKILDKVDKLLDASITTSVSIRVLGALNILISCLNHNVCIKTVSKVLKDKAQGLLGNLTEELMALKSDDNQDLFIYHDFKRLNKRVLDIQDSPHFSKHLNDDGKIFLTQVLEANETLNDSIHEVGPNKRIRKEDSNNTNDESEGLVIDATIAKDEVENLGDLQDS